MAYRSDAHACVEKLLRPLIGCRIVYVTNDPEDFPVIVVENNQGEGWMMFVQQDAEGNGPGFVHVERKETA